MRLAVAAAQKGLSRRVRVIRDWMLICERVRPMPPVNDLHGHGGGVGFGTEAVRSDRLHHNPKSWLMTELTIANFWGGGGTIPHRTRHAGAAQKNLCGNASHRPRVAPKPWLHGS